MTRSTLFRELASRALLIGAPLWCLPVVHAQKADRASSSAEGRRCSNSTLNGAYAFAIEGVFVDAPTPLPLRGVALTRFDGLGHVTQVDHVVFNGGPPPVDWTPATGWYRINADCTGEMELDIPGSPFTPGIRGEQPRYQGRPGQGRPGLTAHGRAKVACRVRPASSATRFVSPPQTRLRYGRRAVAVKCHDAAAHPTAVQEGKPAERLAFGDAFCLAVG